MSLSFNSPLSRLSLRSLLDTQSKKGTRSFSYHPVLISPWLRSPSEVVMFIECLDCVPIMTLSLPGQGPVSLITVSPAPSIAAGDDITQYLNTCS